MASSARRAPGLVPMNGMAGAGLACGIFGLSIAIGFGFWSVPFAVMAVIAGVFAVIFSARGRAIAQQHQQESRLARAGMITGALAMVIGLVGVVLR
ncbi:MAG: hypothetical protein ACXVJW_14100 [Acidimicrobiia bacterium]